MWISRLIYKWDSFERQHSIQTIYKISRTNGSQKDEEILGVVCVFVCNGICVFCTFLAFVISQNKIEVPHCYKHKVFSNYIYCRRFGFVFNGPSYTY